MAEIDKPNFQDLLKQKMSRRSFGRFVAGVAGATALGVAGVAAKEHLNNSDQGGVSGVVGTPQGTEITPNPVDVNASPTGASGTPFPTTEAQKSTASAISTQEPSTEPPATEAASPSATDAPETTTTPENTEVFGTGSMTFETDPSMEKRKQTPIESISLNTKLFPDGKAEKMLDDAVLDFKARAYATGQLIKDNGDSGDWSGLQNFLIHYTDPAPVDTNGFAQKLQNSQELLIPVLANPSGVNRDIKNLKYLHFDAKKQIKVNFIDEPGQIDITTDINSSNETEGYSLVVNDAKELSIYCYFADTKFHPYGTLSTQEMTDLNISLIIPQVLESIVMTHGMVRMENINGTQQKISWENEYMAHGYDGRRTLGGGSIFPEIAEAFAGAQDPVEKWRVGPSLLTVKSPALS